MDSPGSPARLNSKSSLKIASPTTAHSKLSPQTHSSSLAFENIRASINGLITEVGEKNRAYGMGLSAVYKTNEELLSQLDPSRALRAENKELRRELNEALREIIRLHKIIEGLELENQAWRAKFGGRPAYSTQITNQLDELREEGEELRLNVIRLLKKR